MGSCASIQKIEEPKQQAPENRQSLKSQGSASDLFQAKPVEDGDEKLIDKSSDELTPSGTDSDENRVAYTTTVRVIEGEDGQEQINDYLAVKRIGRGAFGKVKLVKNLETEKEYAMKETSKSILKKLNRDARGRPLKSNEMDILLREIAILKKIDHPNVVKLYEVIDDPQAEKLYMIFEYIEKGPVMKLKSDGTGGTPFTEGKARKYFRDLLKGLQYLHANRIIHRDIKPENLLVGSEGTLKVSDFGVSKMLLEGEDDTIRTDSGTPAFLPPEALQSGEFRGKPMDIWACGVTLYAFLYGELPFRASNPILLYDTIIKQEPEYPGKISLNLHDLFTKLLEKDPQKRIKLDELAKHPWVTNHGMQPLTNEVAMHSVSELDMRRAIRRGQTHRHLEKVVLFSKMQKVFSGHAQRAREKVKKRKEAAAAAALIANSSDSELTPTDTDDRSSTVLYSSQISDDTDGYNSSQGSLLKEKLADTHRQSQESITGKTAAQDDESAAKDHKQASSNSSTTQCSAEKHTPPKEAGSAEKDLQEEHEAQVAGE